MHKHFVYISQNCFQQKSNQQVELLAFKQTIRMKQAFLEYFLRPQRFKGTRLTKDSMRPSDWVEPPIMCKLFCLKLFS